MEPAADSAVAVHHAIVDVMMCIIVLRSRGVRYFFSPCAFRRKCPYGAMLGCIVVKRNNSANGQALDGLLCSRNYLCDVLSEGMVKQSQREQVELQDHSHHA